VGFEQRCCACHSRIEQDVGDALQTSASLGKAATCVAERAKMARDKREVSAVGEMRNG
jgi:hypothetical protein